MRDVLPNSLTLVDLPVVDALCELYAPHERVDTGFALLLQPVSTPDRPTGWEGPLILLADRPTGEDGEAHFRTP